MTNEMLAYLITVFSYSVVFSTFNVVAFLVYFIYGFVIYRKKVKKSRSELLTKQITYLRTINFVNVRQNWAKRYSRKIRYFSIIYFVVAEIACFISAVLTERFVLVCRIALFTDIFLILFFVFQVFYYKKKFKRLSAEHEKNLAKALEDYEKTQN